MVKLPCAMNTNESGLLPFFDVVECHFKQESNLQIRFFLKLKTVLKRTLLNLVFFKLLIVCESIKSL